MRKEIRAAVPNRIPQPLNAGERTNPSGKAIANAILLSIPDEEFGLLRPHLEFTALPQRLRIQEPNQKLETAYFLNRGMVSLVFTTHRGESVEVGVVGNEGFTPIPVAAGLRRSPHRAVMQIGGDGFVVSVDALQTVLKSSPALQAKLNRYAAVHGMQVAQTAGCNRLHDIEQRLSPLAAAGPGLRRFGIAAHHSRLFSHDAGHRPSQRESGGRRFAEKAHHRIHARLGQNSEPEETRGLRLRMLWNYSGVQWRTGTAIGPVESC